MKLIRHHIEKVIVAVMCLTPLIWFWGKGEKIINGLDTNFPLDPEVWFLRRFYVWNDTINAGVDSSSSTSGWFFHLLQYIPFKLGFDLQTTQIFTLVFWFSAIVLSSYFFAKSIIPKSKLAHITLTFIYSFNIYLFNTWENVKVANLALMVGIPLMLGIIYRIYTNSFSFQKALFYVIPTAIVTAGSGINPAYFIAIIGASLLFCLFLVFHSSNKKDLVLKFSVLLFAYLLLNVYWMLPFLRYLLVTVSASSFEQIGYTNWVESLSENTSLLNVIRLQGAWDWYVLDNFGLPIYIPYAVNYFYNKPFIAFSFVVPLLAIISLSIKNNKSKIRGFFAILMLIGIFMGSGLHEPTGYIFSLMLKYVPYFSFFRSPWYIFTPYLIIGYAALIGLLIEFVEKNYQIYSKMLSIPKSINLLVFAILIFFVTRSLYLYPLISGKIFRIDRPDSFFVEFPNYVFDSKEIINNRDSTGRIISYPDDQLEQFDWGYRGTESILSLFTDAEVISPSFVFTGKSTQAMLNAFYSHLKKNEISTALKLADYLNSDTLFVKNDSNSLSPDLKLPEYDNKESIGSWDFYTISREPNKIFVPTEYYENSSSDEILGNIIPLIEPNSAIVAKGDTEVAKINDFSEIKRDIIKADNITLKESPSSNHVQYAFEMDQKGIYTIAILKDGLNPNEWSVTSNTLSLSTVTTEQTESSYLIHNVVIPAGKHILDIVFPEQVNLITKENISAVYEHPNLRVDELPADSNTIVAYNPGIEKGTETKILVNNFDEYANYEVSYNYKYSYGGVPFVELIQSHSSAPLKIETLYTGSDTDWVHSKHIFKPVEIVSKLEVAIKTPLKQYEKTSKTFIEDLTVKRIYDNQLFLIQDKTQQLNVPTVKYEKLSPIKYRVKVNNISKSYTLVFSENYSPDWEIRGDDTIGTPLHFSVNGYANGWHIPGNSENQEFVIYYKAQEYYYLAAFVSLLTAIAIIAYGIASTSLKKNLD